jgi:hypothetical protein
VLGSRLLGSVALVVALSVHAGYAYADGSLDMAWTDCVGDATPVTNMAFSCASNTGAHTLVCSFVAPTGITRFAGAEVFIDLISQSTPLPAWWGFYTAGSCRQGSLAVNAGYTGSGAGCSNVWATAPGAGAIAGYGNPAVALPTITAGNSARYATLDAAFALSPGSEVALTAGTQYFLANVTLDNVGSTGVGSCAGCADPVCISFTRVLLSQPGQPDFYLSTPGASSLVTWQGTGADCSAVPVRRATWGAIKSLYR